MLERKLLRMVGFKSLYCKISRTLRSATAVIALLVLVLVPVSAHGHAALVTGGPLLGFEITASYDTGDLMQAAQVAVFAPDRPLEPWMVGVTDGHGRFQFFPDQDLPGIWAVQVRQAGHGAMLYFDWAGSAGTGAQSVPGLSAVGSAVGANATTVSSGTELSWLQRIVMVAAVLWGFLGTALFFLRRSRPHASP